MSENTKPKINWERFLRWYVGLTVGLCLASGLLAYQLRLPVPPPNQLLIFYGLFGGQELSGSLLVASLTLLALGLAIRNPAAPGDRLILWFSAHPWTVAFAAFLVFAASALLVYQAYPLSMDEYAPYFQARAFAAGKLWGEIPPDLLDSVILEDFQGGFFTVSHETGRVISNYWPSHALLLTPFMALGVPWLLNPLLGAGSLLLIWRLTRDLVSQPAAPGWAVLLALSSPQFTANAMSFYSMPGHLFFNLLFVWLLIRGGWKSAFGAGVAGSVALTLHNPVPHLVFAPLWILWVLVRRRDWRSGLALLSGYLPLSVILGIGWFVLRSLVGDSGGSAEVGILAIVASFAGAFRLPVVDETFARLLGWLKLSLWTVPGLVFLAAGGFMASRGKTVLRLLGWTAIVTLLVYLCVPFTQGHGWGFRYFHQAWGVLPILGAVLMARATREKAFLARVVAGAALLSLVVATPFRFQQAGSFIRGHRAQLPPLEPGVRQVCFINHWQGYYRKDLIQNDPFLRNSIWILGNSGPEADQALVRRWFRESRLTYDDGFDRVWEVGDQRSRETLDTPALERDGRDTESGSSEELGKRGGTPSEDG